MLNKKSAILMVLALIMSVVLTACGPTSEPQIVEKVVTQTVKETVIVEGTPQVVEKEVTQVVTVEVEKVVTVEVEKVVTPTPEATEQPEMRKGGTLVISDAQSNQTFDPFKATWHMWTSALYSSLFLKGKDLEYVGYLADTWEISEDGSLLTVKLIENATFSDGTPVNAEAIKWNFDHYLDPDVGAVAGDDLRGLLEEVEVVDDYKLALHLAYSYAPLLRDLNVEIVSPTAYEKWGPDNFALHAVGAGPFVLKTWVTDNYVLFERNPDFTWAPEEVYEHPGPTYLDGFEIKFISEEQTVLSALETGEIHFAEVPTQNLADVEANSDIVVHSQLRNWIRYIGFNTSKAPWDNPDLRRALSYAVNRPEVVALVFDGLAEPLYQPLPQTIWGHNPDLDAMSYSYHYDPDKAMEMLDELGYVDVDGDGFREDPAGELWSVPLAASSTDVERRFAEVIEGQFRDVGIKLEIDMMEIVALIDLTTTGEHDLFLLWYGSDDPSILTYFFDPERIGGSNRAWYNNEELANLLSAADKDINLETRYEKITAVSEMIIEEAPWIFVCTPVLIYGVRDELKGWEFSPEGEFFYWNAYLEVEE